MVAGVGGVRGWARRLRAGEKDDVKGDAVVGRVRGSVAISSVFRGLLCERFGRR